MANETLQAVGRLRRAMPRNADVMLVCDALEQILANKGCEECERRRIATRNRVRKHRDGKKS